MKKLKVGDIVLAKFLGAPYYCKVTEVVSRDVYKLQTFTGNILPNVSWKKKSAVDKRGKVISPWYIEELYKPIIKTKK
jgi:hypothetical protein